MIGVNDLLTVANDRLQDAECLYNSGRYDGAVYLCGYAIEIALKHKICLTLNWAGFPSTNNEFTNFKSLKTHNLEVLLSFTGIEAALKSTNLAEWSTILNWDPESRYNLVGQINQQDALDMINSAKKLIPLL